MTNEQLNRDSRHKYSDFPADQITIGGLDYDCIRITGHAERRPLEIGGFDDDPLVTVAIRNVGQNGSTVLPSMPTVGSIARLDTRDYRIDRITKSPYGGDILLDLRTPY